MLNTCIYSSFGFFLIYFAFPEVGTYISYENKVIISKACVDSFRTDLTLAEQD